MSPTPKRTHDQVSFEGTTIEYRVRRNPRRKNMIDFFITPDGLLVSAPARASYAKIRSIVLKRAAELLEFMARAPRGGQPLPLVTGDSLPYLGRSYPMAVESVKTAKPSVELNADTLRVSVPQIPDDKERRQVVRKALETWYRDRGRDYMPPVVDEWWRRMGIRKKHRVIVRTQRTLWGSCAPDGTLRFSWRNMMLSPDIIEYVVVHELAHLKVKGHSAKFWGVVTRALPDAMQRRELLRKSEAFLPL